MEILLIDIYLRNPLKYVSELLGPKMKEPILNQHMSFYVILTGKIQDQTFATIKFYMN